jgi:hypothetical protein
LRRVIWFKFTDVSEVLAASINNTKEMMMEAANTSDMSVNFYLTTRCKNPEKINFRVRSRENLKCY